MKTKEITAQKKGGELRRSGTQGGYRPAVRRLLLWCLVFVVSASVGIGGWGNVAYAAEIGGPSATGSGSPPEVETIADEETQSPSDAAAPTGGYGDDEDGGTDSAGLPTAEYWDEVTPKGVGTADITPETTMYNTDPTISILDLGNIGNALNKAVFGMFGGLSWQLAKLVNDFMGQLGSITLFDEGFSSGAYNVVYDVCIQVADNVAIPVATGFLGLALVLALINFTKDVAQTNHGTTDLLANYMFIIVKFGVLQLAISNTTLIMQGIYELVREIGEFMTTLVSPATPGALAYTDGFAGSVNEILKSITYQQGCGAAILVTIIALAGFICAILTMVYVNVVAIMRMFEVYVRSAFAALPMVMLGNRTTKDGGIRYFKKYAGCCLQALVVILIVAIGSPMMSAGGTMLADAIGSGSGGFAGLIMAVLPSVCSCVALLFMVKQSRQIADEIVGA